MNVFGQLKKACLEILSSSPGGTVTGRIWWRSDIGKAQIDSGAQIRNVLLNDDKAVLGTSGTAATNVRLHRGGTAVLQQVLGSDATAEGSLSANLAQSSSRVENYTDAGKPTFGNGGRLAYLSDIFMLGLDIGSAWKYLVDTTTAQTLTNKTIVAGSNTISGITVAMMNSGAAASGKVATANGSAGVTWEDATTIGVGTQTFTSNDTFVVPAGVTSLLVEACGGGGGGGGGGTGSGSGGGGGGGGAPVFSRVVTVVPGETITIVIGTGGAGGAIGTVGVVGVSTTLVGSTSGALLTAIGGGFGGDGFDDLAGAGSDGGNSIGAGGGGGDGTVTGGGGGGGSTGPGGTSLIGSARSGSNGGGGAGGNTSTAGSSGGPTVMFVTAAAGGSTAASGGGGGGGGSGFGIGGAGGNGAATPTAGTAAAANTGGGGGGGGGSGDAGAGAAGAAGGSGKVILRWGI